MPRIKSNPSLTNLNAPNFKTDGSSFSPNWLNDHIEKIKLEAGVEIKNRSSNRARQLSRKLSTNISTFPIGLFDFRASDFINSVVTPSYRNLDQPQYYYVSRIK